MLSKITVCMMLLLIKGYQYGISPIKQYFFGPGSGCRFYPSCSEYSKEAYKKHGFFRGSYLTAQRILKCQPLHSGGYDPVPNTFTSLKKNYG